MAKSKKAQRRRKHRGTQSGRIDTRGRTRRPRTRAEARGATQQRRRNRFEEEPTLKGAVGRAGLAAGFFLVLVILILGQPLAPSILLGLLAFAIYVPLGHWMDRFMYRRYQRKKARQAEEKGTKGR